MKCNMIDKIVVDNFKCFDEMKLEMTTLNVFAGINSMGKSSAIQPLLLLRQSFEMNSLTKGVHLNGPWINIGTGYDFLNRNANEDYVKFAMTADGKEYYWKYDYDKKSDYQSIKETNAKGKELENINLFKPNFSYISADRIGPKRFYEQSFHQIYEMNQVGINGELFADYLAERGMTDRVTNKYALHKTAASDLLIYQTEAWLSEISPGIKLSSKKYQETGIVGMEYNVANDKFSPLNVGFGLSYVAPIVVSLLKAREGDLLILDNPEAHLHPKGQRMMGELIARVASGRVQIIVETHSDHILNGIRLAVKNKIISRLNVRLNYFYQELTDDLAIGKRMVHKKMSPAILEDGRLSYWPEGFFDEWDKALEELL